VSKMNVWRSGHGLPLFVSRAACPRWAGFPDNQDHYDISTSLSTEDVHQIESGNLNSVQLMLDPAQSVHLVPVPYPGIKLLPGSTKPYGLYEFDCRDPF